MTCLCYQSLNEQKDAKNFLILKPETRCKDSTIQEGRAYNEYTNNYTPLLCLHLKDYVRIEQCFCFDAGYYHVHSNCLKGEARAVKYEHYHRLLSCMTV